MLLYSICWSIPHLKPFSTHHHHLSSHKPMRSINPLMWKKHTNTSTEVTNTHRNPEWAKSTVNIWDMKKKYSILWGRHQTTMGSQYNNTEVLSKGQNGTGCSKSTARSPSAFSSATQQSLSNHQNKTLWWHFISSFLYWAARENICATMFACTQ